MINEDFHSTVDFLTQIAQLKEFLKLTLKPSSFDAIVRKLEEFLEKLPKNFWEKKARNYKDSLYVSKNEFDELSDFIRGIQIDLGVFLISEKRKNVLACAVIASKIMSGFSLTIQLFKK
jgi:hypothetical protein